MEQIYNDYYRDVYLFLLGLTKNERIAEDISQETFFKAMKSINRYEGKCDIKIWLFQIAKNTYFSYYKKQKHIILDEHLEEHIYDFSFEEHLSDKDEKISIHKILHSIEEPYKEVFTLRIFGELSFKQIGSIFDKTESWARVTYYRGKLKIISKMEELNHE